ncbi:MAG: hypothetical protein ACK4R6_13105 [Spirosomataceae bacterium]
MTKYILAFAVAAFTLSSCETNEIEPLSIPTTYDGSAFVANTTNEYELRANFTKFVDEIKKGRVSGVVVTAAQIQATFEAGGANSVSRAIPASELANYQALFTEVEKASRGTTYQFGFTPAQNGQGGVNNGYLYDETGLELEQILDKGSFGLIFFRKGQQLLQNPTLENLDKALALFGANPTFPNTPTASKTQQPDVLMANYGARRTPAAGGLYTQVRDAFIKAQAAIKAGATYNTERDEAIQAILLGWEEINAATVINYLFATETGLSTTNADQRTLSNAMHAYGECVGFLQGFKGASGKKITDAQIDAALVSLNATQPYRLLNSPTEIAKLVTLRRTLQSIYGFSDTETESFRNNWITVEAR